jgi:hypothetical protein
VAAHKGHPGGCTVCASPERVRVELLLAGGAGQTAVARKFGLSPHSLHRHWRNHVSEARRARLIMGPVQVQALSAQVAEENTCVLDNLRIVRSGIYRQYDAALEAGDRVSGALLAGKLHENLRITARITGELASSPLVTITNNQQSLTVLTSSPMFAAFQAQLLRVLQRHPSALDDVVAEFSRLEREASPATLPALEHVGEQRAA